MTISKDEIEQARLMSEFKYQVDLQSHLVYAEQKGEVKGEQKIINLLKNGISPEEIIKDYG
jgi:hypothetical protein